MKYLILILLLSCSSKKASFERNLPHKDLKLCFIGDTGAENEFQRRVAESLRKEKCHSIHFAGDLVYPSGLMSDKDPEFENKFWNYYEKLTEENNKPNIFLSMGNHDHEGSIDSWIKISEKHPKIFFPNPWYLIRTNNLCLVHLDSVFFRFTKNYLVRKEELDWLKSLDLKTCKIKIAVAHHPYNSSGHHHGNSKADLREILEEYIIGKFDYFIAGHEHILSDEGVVRGTRLLISGAGGQRDTDTGGYLVLNIQNDHVTYSFRKMN